MTRFYRVTPKADGTVDVLLFPAPSCLLAVPGVNPHDPAWHGDLETHIRAHFAAWCSIGEPIEL